MNKTKLTIALMGSMAVTSAFATTGAEGHIKHAIDHIV
jgi:hypothetical protein